MRGVPTYLGLDGFRFGWVAAWIDDRGDHGFDYSPGLTRLLELPHARAMIDMPIGLPFEGYRVCDREARKIIGPSVFLGARRDVWTFTNMASANAKYREDGQPGISCQLWNIKEKFKQVDDFISPERQETVREAHPELIFWRLSDQERLPSKKSPEGRERRIAILERHGFGQLRRWLNLLTRTGIGRDDLIDACACAVAARDSTQRVGGAEIDPRGLRMEINY